MADQTVEQILSAARKRVRTKEIDLGGVKVVVRELPRRELRALIARCWKVDTEGNPITFDKPGGDGIPITSGMGWRHLAKPDVNVTREWLLATLTPVEVVDGLLADDVPDSVVDEIFAAARAVNGESVASAAGN
jgi:hypothetical protein